MPRQPRLQNQSGWHHVTNRGLDRQRVFRTIDDRLDFGRLLGSGHDNFGVGVLAYCLMDNHYHLVLSCADGGLSDFMQHIGAQFTRHANERHGGDGPIFRSRFFSRPIRSPGYLLNAVRYVHRNPIDIRPSVRPEQYRWSSHRTYLGLRGCPHWLSCSPVLDWFRSPAAFGEFVGSGIARPQSLVVDVDDLMHTCSYVIDAMWTVLDRAPQGVLRTVSYLLLDRVDDDARRGLVDRLAPASSESLDQAVWRARRLASANPAYTAIADRVLDLLAPTFKLCLTQLESQGSQAGRVAS